MTALIRRAVLLFPRTDYLDPASVRHNRRQWLRSIAYLRCSGKWVLDQKQERLQ